ncbi:MAG: hypothetical protein IJL80_11080 [Treponema sp.]|nr:hypothetical protein [Treponema sp.]
MSEVAGKSNPPFGRKVFFVNPSFKVQTKMLNVLRENEYEVYIIQKWRDVKNFLSKNPDSVCFISVDSQMPLLSWMAMVDSFSKDKVLSTIICGFLTENAVKDSGKVMEIVRLEAGYNTTSGDEMRVLKVLQNVLDVFGAKGRRQHVRCSCFKENAFVYFTLTDAGGNPSMFQMKIVDISSATVAVEVPEVLRGKLKVGIVFQSVIITLNGRQLNIGLRVFLMKRTEKDTEIAIFAYPSSFSSEAKTYIRNFIFTTLQKEMDRSINGMSEDKTDYNLEAQSFQLLKDAYAAGVKMEEKKEKEEKAEKEEEAEDKPEGEGEEKEEAAEEPGKDASEEKAGGEEPSGESA